MTVDGLKPPISCRRRKGFDTVRREPEKSRRVLKLEEPSSARPVGNLLASIGHFAPPLKATKHNLTMSFVRELRKVLQRERPAI